MGIDELESGMALVPLLIGVFVISEVIVQAEKAAKIKMMDVAPEANLDKSEDYFTWAEFKRCTPLMFRSSIYGSLIGMMPVWDHRLPVSSPMAKKNAVQKQGRMGHRYCRRDRCTRIRKQCRLWPIHDPTADIGYSRVHNCSRFDWYVLGQRLQPGPTIFATEPPLFMGGS